MRNLDNVHVLVADQLNTYDVLCADDVVFPRRRSTRSSSASDKSAKADKEDVK